MMPHERKQNLALLIGLLLCLVSGLQAAAPPTDTLMLQPNPGPSGTLRSNFTGNLGTAFRVNETLSVTKLGFYDYGSNGLNNSAGHTVRLYESNDNAVTGTILAEVTVPAGAAAPLSDGFRWVDLPGPVVIGPQTGIDWYMLSATVQVADGDPWYNIDATGFTFNSYMGFWSGRFTTNPAGFPDVWGGNDTTTWYVANMAAEPLSVASSISLDKTVYYSGEDITVTYSGTLGDPADTVAFYYASLYPAGQNSLSGDITGTDGQVTISNSLAVGDYVATYMYEGTGPVGSTVAFSVVAGPSTGRDVETKVLIGPEVPSYQLTDPLADPQVYKEGSTYYITGTYAFFDAANPYAYMYSTDDFQTITSTEIKIETLPWLDTNQHIWAFEIYKDPIGGRYHAYGFDYYRGGTYHFEPYPDPATTTFPVLHWKANEYLVAGYDNKIIHDGTDMYLLSVEREASTTNSIYCQKMLNPGAMHPGYTPRKIMSENGDGLTSELTNRGDSWKIHEGPSITQVSAPGGSKYVLSYTVGNWTQRRYKMGFAYSDVLIPPAGTEYTKVTKADTLNIWNSGVDADEVVYVTQTEKPSAPNYHAAIFNRPGCGDVIEYNGSYYMIYHAGSPILTEDMTGNAGYDPGRMTWIMPLDFDFRGLMDTWATADMPTGTQAPVLTPSKPAYAKGEDIVINFQNAGQGAWDWIGMFNDGDPTGSYLDWKYVQGLSQTFLNDWGGDIAAWEVTNYGFSGSMTFPGRDTFGAYDGRFYFSSVWDPVAASCDFVVAGFASDSFTKPPAIEGRAYSNTLAGTVTYPGGGGVTLEYSLVSGPSWLTVASDGQLSGVPADAHVGSNNFTVRVTDNQGFTDDTSVQIYVQGRYTGELGISDLQAFAAQWLNTSCGTCGEAELNGDGNVNMEDMAVFAGHWLK